MKICEGKIQKEVIFIMRNSNKTREKITGVLIVLVLSALCVTPAFAAGSDVGGYELFIIFFALFGVIMLCLFMFLNSL